MSLLAATPTKKRRILGVFVVCILAAWLTACGDGEYDLVISGGRVIDPESGFDEVRHVGIRGKSIEAISEEELSGRETIDASRLVVTSGFIDLHAHGQDIENSRFQVMDGVTTALELEVGVGDIDGFYSGRSGKSHNHFGATIGHIPVRMRVMKDPGDFLPSGAGGHMEATDTEIEEMRRQIEHGLEQGAIGVGFGIQYTPAASRWEILEAFRAADRHDATCFVHIRHSGPVEPNSGLSGLEEALAAAAITGASLHVVHVNSVGGLAAPLLLEMIAGARSHGLDVTGECYPYTAGMTRIESAFFDGNWREAYEISYEDLQWVETAERLTEESYERYRAVGGMVIIHQNPQSIVDTVVQNPMTMIASDGHLKDGKGHPRTAGTYSRILGRYVRERGLLSLTDALRKMSSMPARRLENRVPAMKNKGLVAEGADADLVLFDPNRIIDRASFEEPAVFSDGMRHVLVHGVAVVRDGALVENAFPGKGIRAPIREGEAGPGDGAH